MFIRAQVALIALNAGEVTEIMLKIYNYHN